MADYLETIARNAGGEVHGKQASIPGPGHSKFDRSLSLTIGDRGQIIWRSFANDSWQDVLPYLKGLGAKFEREPLSDEKRAALEARQAADNRARAGKRDIAADLWARARSVRGSLAERYLQEARGVALPQMAMVRYLPDCPFKPYHPEHETYPTMIAAISNGAGEIIGAHLTFLAADGKAKAAVNPSRKVIGQQKGGVIKLGVMGPMIVIGEGIESALSAGAACGLPALAAISAGNMAAIELPAGVEGVLIAFDREEAGVGRKAAAQLHKRLTAAGVSAEYMPPPASLKDWNEVEQR